MKPQNSDFSTYNKILFYQIYIKYFFARKYNWFSEIKDLGIA